MELNKEVLSLTDKFYSTEDEKYMAQADQLCINNNLMYDYICNHARFHDRNDQYWLDTTGIADFTAKCSDNDQRYSDIQIVKVLTEHNITVKHLHEVDQLMLAKPDYDTLYS